MEDNNKLPTSIWGKWWSPIRKWFYPSWLIYETSYRFYDYAVAVHLYLKNIGNEYLALVSGMATFMVCTAFLTVSTSFLLFKFFSVENLTGTRFEERMKPLF
ncbi:hypothetical protein ACEZ3G_12755 [Maribacter algicola]|uniref:Uncharacterized protein n=1 Tax=Meishania litoralis TaxID=3434685 RepID=A0ACC7LL83_9FLAO